MVPQMVDSYLDIRSVCTSNTYALCTPLESEPANDPLNIQGIS